MSLKNALRDLPLGSCIVEHQPYTPRYQRANAKLRYLRAYGTVLGVREGERPNSVCLEIAVWAPEPAKRKPGYYACFRVYLEEERPVLAVLYCFYDGTDQSPAFRSLESAAAFSLAQGFRDEA